MSRCRDPNGKVREKKGEPLPPGREAVRELGSDTAGEEGGRGREAQVGTEESELLRNYAIRSCSSPRDERPRTATARLY